MKSTVMAKTKVFPKFCRLHLSGVIESCDLDEIFFHCLEEYGYFVFFPLQQMGNKIHIYVSPYSCLSGQELKTNSNLVHIFPPEVLRC